MSNSATNNTMGAVALPVAMDLQSISMGTIDIRPVPTKIIKCYVVQDSYVRSDFPNMNYGRDGQFIAGQTTQGSNFRTYLRFDLTQEKAKLDLNDVIDAKMYLYSDSTPDNYPLAFHEVPNDNWYENDINWLNAPAVDMETQLGTLAQTAERAYSASSSLKSLVLKENIISMAFGENQGLSSLFAASRETLNPPYIGIEVIDRAAYALSSGTYDASLQFTPTIMASEHIPMDFNLISKNLVNDIPTQLGVSTIPLAGNYTLSITEYPFEVKVIQKKLEDIPAQLGVSATPNNQAQILAILEVPIKFSPTLLVREFYTLQLGVSTVPLESADILATEHIPFNFVPTVCKGLDATLALGVAAPGIAGSSTLAVAEFPMEFNVVQLVNTLIPCRLGVTAPLDSLGSILSTFEIPFDMYVPSNYFIPLRIDVRAHEHYSMDIDVVQVLMIPFTIDVKSPYFPINFDVVRGGADYIPFTVIPLIRDVHLVPIELRVRIPSTYAFIV